MKRGWRSMSALLVLLTAGFLSPVGGKATYAASQNLVESHRNAGNLPDKECLSCHAEISKAVTLDRKIKTLHRLHLESKLGTPKNCSDCHRSVDLREGSASALRKQIDPGVCAECHTGDMEGAKVLFAK